MPAMSSVQRSPEDGAGSERDREHHRLGSDHAPSARTQFGLPHRRVREAVQMADLVQRNGLQIEEAGFSLRGHRPRERGVEEDVGLDNRAGDRIDHERRRAKRAIEIRAGSEIR